MTRDQANALLRPAVIAWSFAGLIGIPLAVYFDFLGAWRWTPYNPVYDQMIVSIYVAVGICSALAIRDPLRHASFLWFVAVSSYTHGLVMLFHALHNPHACSSLNRRRLDSRGWDVPCMAALASAQCLYLRRLTANLVK